MIGRFSEALMAETKKNDWTLISMKVVYDRTQVTGAQVAGGWLNRSINETEGRVIIAVAIKYQ